MKNEKRNGAGHGVRTRDIQLGKLAPGTRTGPKTLGQKHLRDLSVTKSVTSDTENAVRLTLLKTLKNMPKEDLVALLAAAISNEGNHTKA